MSIMRKFKMIAKEKIPTGHQKEQFSRTPISDRMAKIAQAFCICAVTISLTMLIFGLALEPLLKWLGWIPR